MATNYSKWDDLYDSDEERKKQKYADEAKRKADALKARQNAGKQPPIPGGMSEQQFAEQYARMFSGNKNKPKQPYKFPETMEEQRAKWEAQMRAKRDQLKKEREEVLRAREEGGGEDKRRMDSFNKRQKEYEVKKLKKEKEKKAAVRACVRARSVDRPVVLLSLHFLLNFVLLLICISKKKLTVLPVVICGGRSALGL
mgnify:CR=1 FL=1